MQSDVYDNYTAPVLHAEECRDVPSPLPPLSEVPFPDLPAYFPNFTECSNGNFPRPGDSQYDELLKYALEEGSGRGTKLPEIRPQPDAPSKSLRYDA